MDNQQMAGKINLGIGLEVELKFAEQCYALQLKTNSPLYMGTLFSKIK